MENFVGEWLALCVFVVADYAGFSHHPQMMVCIWILFSFQFAYLEGFSHSAVGEERSDFIF